MNTGQTNQQPQAAPAATAPHVGVFERDHCANHKIHGKNLGVGLRNRACFAWLLLFGLSILASTGCRQPVGNSGNRPALFDLSRTPKLFGGNSSIGNSSIGNSSFANGFGSGTNGQASGSLFGGGSQVANNQGNPNLQANPLTGEVQNLSQRLGAYDSDNQLLNTEVAALKQKLQLANQYNQTLKQQLSDTSGRIQQSEMARQTALQQLAATQAQVDQVRQASQNNGWGPNSNGSGQLVGHNSGSAPSQLAGGATIRANNSLMQAFANIRIPGGQARMDGDVVRIEFPSDMMFVPGTYQIQPAQLPVMQNIVSTIRQNFPKQIIGIEAHWDNTPLNPSTTTHHQLTATQSLAVFDNLVRLGLPQSQMFTMAMASNRPRHPQGVVNGISPNRRIELVIYPETFDGT